MASNYPTSIDSFTDPLSNSPLNNPSHAAQHQDVNDAVEKLETKLGVGSSPASGAASGHVLVANGSGSTTWQAPAVTAAQFATVGLVKILSTSWSGATQVDFLNVFSSSYTNYRIVFDYWTVTVAENHLFRLRDSGGVLSGSNYLSQRLESATTSVNGLQIGGGYGTAWFPTYINTGAGTQVSGHMDIFRPNEAAITTAVGQWNRADPSFFYSVQGAHYYNLTTVCTGFSLVRNSTATMTGKATVYGYTA